MNLAVQVFIDREDGERDLFDPPTDAGGEAGYDSWRDTVWGSQRARALGADLLPRLAEDDLYVEPERVEKLLQECNLLRDNLDKLVPGMDALAPHPASHLVNAGAEVRFESDDAAEDFRQTVADRLANIEAAARYALVVGGGVAISTSTVQLPEHAPPDDASDPEPPPLDPPEPESEPEAATSA